MPAEAAGVVVVGGGIAGLSAAWELSRALADGTRRSVTVLESGASVGGKLRSAPFAGRLVDLGADAFLTRRPEAIELCAELGLHGDLVAPATGTAYVWARGRLRALPAGLALGVPTRIAPLARSGILSPGGLARAAVDLVQPSGRGGGSASAPDEAIGELVRKRLGREVFERLADPLIGGIHAGSALDMSAAAVFPDLLRAARQPGGLMRNLRPPPPVGSRPDRSPGPVFLGLRGGMAQLVEGLQQGLEERGVTVRRGWPVTALRRDGRWHLEGGQGETAAADAVVLATPAFVTARLVGGVAPRLAERLSGVAYASVTLVTMRFRQQDLGPLPPGSGLLVPRTSGGMVTACTWLSAKWPELARPGEVLVRVSFGRYGDSRADALGDDAVVEQACRELAVPMAISAPPAEAMVVRFADAFPQYRVGHLALVADMERAAARLGGLALAGSFLQGVGVPACVASGRRAARSVSGHLEQTARQ
jgi:oxygen-dependent protoporphyrinogen oxidase